MQTDMSNMDTGFMLVTSKKPLPKKQHAVDDQQHMQPAFIMAICIHFPMVSNGKNVAFNPLTHVKAVLDVMHIMDASISIQPITTLGDVNPPGDVNMLGDVNPLTMSLHSSDAIPHDEHKFKQYFLIFEVKYKQIAVAFQIGSMKSMKDIKFALAVMEWLHKEHIYIDADSIGMHKMAIIGWFTQVHTCIIHHETMQEKILESLSQVSITSDEVLKLDASQHGILQAANESGDEFQPKIPKFELFLTKIGSGSGKTHVVMDVIGVKCAVENFPLLHKLFA